MATRYRIYKTLGEDCEHLTYLGVAEAFSATAAARVFFASRDDVPEHLAVIPDSAVHYLPAAVETQTRLRLG